MVSEKLTVSTSPEHGSNAVTAGGPGTAEQSTVASAGIPFRIGWDWLIILIVAGDSSHAGSVLGVPAGYEPQAAASTYLVLILYPTQLSATGGLLPPHVMPSSKLYSMVNPASGDGGVTMMGPQPGLTVGAGGSGGKIITLSVLLAPQAPTPAVPAGVVPQLAVNTYLACTV